MTRKSTYAAVPLLCLLLSVNGFGQTVNATVGGTVGDASGALIPGVTVMATNTGTGIVNTVVSNESGAYQFPALQPGTYKISAELPGFQTQTFTNVQLGGAQQVRLNFTLQVAAAAGTNVEVTVAADTLLATSSNSIGTILPEYKIRDLPAITGNVFNIVANVPGVQRDNTGTFGYMAGGRLGDVNATRDGVNVNDGRYENGAWSVVFTSPDLVEEVKVIVAPVDAETSRGSGQVAMVTRSGTNQFRGSVYWINHNSALDANDWFNNQTNTTKSYDNRNQYGARLGGPIIKNKTFFFALFSGQRDLKKNQATGITLTDYAKAGIFRYWPGVDPANAAAANPSVDAAGRPIVPAGANLSLLSDPTQPAAVGLFGSCSYKGAAVANCRTFSDTNRTAFSTNPFIQEELRRMPSPNQFTSNGNQVPDGLNTALIRFTRRQEGLDLTNGNGDEVDRDQYNLRIDHNFNSKHKVSLIGTKEKTWGTATQAGLRSWPDAFDGLAVKRPYVYSIQLTSTLTSNILNQLRLSKRASNNWQWGSADRGDEIGAEARKLHPSSNGIPYQVQFSTTAGGITQRLPSFSNIGGFGRWREGINPMKSIGDDVSWSVRRHAFKAGYEWRRQESNGFNDPNYTPLATLGAGQQLVVGLDGNTFTGMSANASTNARNLLYDLAGSVNDIRQAFGVVSASDTKLQGTPIVPNNRHWNFQSEMSAYFKDDWKFRDSLTLNLGVHYEYYGQPYEHDGNAARIIGNQDAYTNVNCTSNIGAINSFFSTCSNLVQVQFIGKNSTHADVNANLLGNDKNNFAPSVGLAWNVPWFGKGKTVIRTGYGISYEGALRNFITVDSVIGAVPGINLTGSNNNGLQYLPSAYTTLSTVGLPIPKPAGTPDVAPFIVPTTDRSLGITTYNHVSPYTQNWNFEIQRELARNTTIEVRYIGTKGTKLWGQFNLNSIDVNAHNKALYDALVTARNGGESPLLDTLLMGTTFGGGTAVVNGSTLTGAGALRQSTTTRQFLANGAFGALMNTLNTTNVGVTVPAGATGNGYTLRRNGFPDNYFVPSPQYTNVNIDGNHGNSTYHALQMQFTRRLTAGFSGSGSYTWSKAMGLMTTTAGSVAPNNAIDPSHFQVKGLQNVDRKHQITANATYELPAGSGHQFLGGAPGWVQRVVGKWQVGGIFNIQTGAPLTLMTGVNTITNQGANPTQVGKIPSDFGKITKNPNGVTYFDGYKQIADPGLAAASPTCAASASACNTLSAGYSNKAILDPKGNMILVNPGPGQGGTLGYATVRGPGAMYFDMNLVKRVQITETKQFEVRIDAVNILNHPNFAPPNNTSLSINDASFGTISSLAAGANIGGNGGMRSFIVNTRLNF